MLERGRQWRWLEAGAERAGPAGHCYIDKNNGCNDNFDPSSLPPAPSNWALKPNLDWLATFGTKRVF